ncbi:MAG: hypothetical protein OXE59_10060 [Bacteroidetes bacterium]|nr:hypothetical protein [Bacteroidota bacterium]
MKAPKRIGHRKKFFRKKHALNRNPNSDAHMCCILSYCASTLFLIEEICGDRFNTTDINTTQVIEQLPKPVRGMLDALFRYTAALIQVSFPEIDPTEYDMDFDMVNVLITNPETIENDYQTYSFLSLTIFMMTQTPNLYKVWTQCENPQELFSVIDESDHDIFDELPTPIYNAIVELSKASMKYERWKFSDGPPIK